MKTIFNNGFNWIRPAIGEFALSILLSIGDVVCVAVYPYLLSWIVDHFESLTPHDIFRCVGLLLLSVLLTLVIQYGNKIVKVRFETKIMSQLRSSLFHQILRLENSTFQASKIESYTTFLLNDLDDFYALFFENGIYFFSTCVMLATYTVVLYIMSPVMCVFVMGSLLLVLFLPSLLGKNFDPLTKKHMESRKDYVARTEELLRSHELYTKEMAEKSEHLELMKLTQMQSKKAILGRYRSLVQILSGSTLYIQLLLCFGVGLFLVVQDVISVGVFASSLIYVEYVSMSSVNLVDELLEMKSARAYFQQIQSLQGKKERSFLSLPALHQTLHLEKIAYRVENKVLLHPISVTFDPGKKYLITGPNGSGKSTLLKIVAGLLEPTEGAIVSNGKQGVKLKEKKAQRAKVQYIPQTRYLFEGTVEENLSFFQDQVENNMSKKMRELAERFGLGLALDLKIEKNGANLSGGEQAKINLIRGLIQDADWYLIDEPFNDVDVLSQKRILEYVQSLDATVILIAHGLNGNAFDQEIQLNP